jgi:hypothetical protein
LGAFDGELITLRQLVAIGGVLTMVALVQFRGGRETVLAAKMTTEEPHFCPSENPIDVSEFEPALDVRVADWAGDKGQ